MAHFDDLLLDDENEKKTLSESAAEYTESHTNKRKYDVVDVVTGDKTKRSSLVVIVKFDVQVKRLSQMCCKDR